MVDSSYFLTERRINELQRAKEREEKKKQRAAPDSGGGTVGCVALDCNGNLAAATSTGGKTNKYPGRIGDSPIIGAGNYADNHTCAISGTGDGEYFIRGVAAYDISALMLYGGMTLQEAADTVVMSKLKKLGGTGGVIGLDGKGNIAMPFNTEGMYRGFIDKDGRLEIQFYRD
jgi:beta-aspartyl-peptidase (threonine type)